MPMQFCRFPAKVVMGDGTEINRSAVVVIDGRAELAVQNKRSDFDGGQVSIVATLDGVNVDAQGREATLTGESGEVWTVGQGDGCGCRSSLQSWYAGRIQGVPMGT